MVHALHRQDIGALPFERGVLMTTETSRALVRRLFDEVINHWNFAHLAQMFAPTFRVAPDQDRPARGVEDAQQFFLWLQSAFPDLHYTIDDVVVEGELAVARVHARGTHRGEWHGHSPTGLPVEYEEMVMLRVVNGKITEWSVALDRLHILEQIGAYSGATESTA
jgi:ketosteroid isomerase-like protein